MADSALTKRLIADGFKAVMDKKSFDKITIADITDQCGLNRQTFYYHFQDKYELLNWILYTDVITPLANGLTIDNWPEKLLMILNIVQENSRFYVNAFSTAHGGEFRQYLFNVVAELLSDIIGQITEGHPVTPDDKQFIAEFLSYGVTGSIVKWVKTGMKRSPEATVQHMQDIVNGCKHFVASKYFP